MKKGLHLKRGWTPWSPPPGNNCFHLDGNLLNGHSRTGSPSPFPRLFTMGREDYISTGGSLKLKGVKDGGIKKKKNKKPATPDPTSEQKSREGSAKATSADGVEKREEGEPEDPYAGKTEAERRFEERKRKRMDERLKKDGIKSHKERVEEFNKYLSNLSEHHDMPRIGPG